ncbi:MAG: hypothetical protein HY866_09270 [Chloroflexi bacterium]|nr:hypothetical protein [Chloroflexota bacterium]
MKRFVVFITLLASVFLLFPSGSALGYPGDTISEVEWVYPCDSVVGAVGFHFVYYIPVGYKVVDIETGSSPTWGDYYWSNEFVVEGSPLNADFYDVIVVPPDGWFEYRAEIFAPDGTLVTSVFVLGSCPDGLIRTASNNIYGINPPTQRAMGFVNYDTPLYSEANPSTVRTETLTAGQTWFVVAEKTGTDGQPWYEVFVGGYHNAFVPADALTLDGPLP